MEFNQPFQGMLLLHVFFVTEIALIFAHVLVHFVITEIIFFVF